MVAVIALALPVAAGASESRVKQLRDGIAWHRSQTWAWQDTAFVKRTRTAHAEQRTRSVKYLRWLARHWSVRRMAARIHAQNPPNLSFWMCVHGREGAWNDPNAPYWGGLQMGTWFMRTYGWNLLQRKGTADNWTPLEQVWVAERAWQKEGYSVSWLYGQWPNTAPPCR